MKTILVGTISGMPFFLSFLIVALLLVLIGVITYCRITPYKEMELTKQNNVSASISLSSTIIAITIPIAFCLATSVNIYDLVIWGFISIIFQIIMFFIMNYIIKDIRSKIKNDQLAPVIVYSASKISSSAILAATIVG